MNLGGEFTSGGQDQCTNRATLASVYPWPGRISFLHEVMEHWQGKRGRFSCSGLSTGQQIMPGQQ